MPLYTTVRALGTNWGAQDDDDDGGDAGWRVLSVKVGCCTCSTWDRKAARQGAASTVFLPVILHVRCSC